MPLTPGTTLGPYEILSPIGAGGMGGALRLVGAARRALRATQLQGRAESPNGQWGTLSAESPGVPLQLQSAV